MATTPRPYIWKGYQTIATGVQATGSTLHYYTGIDAQHLYVGNTGQLKSQRLEIEDGHWEDPTAVGNPKLLSPYYRDYKITNFAHPSTGTVYGVAIDEETIGIPWIFYYDYMRDVSNIVQTGTWRMRLDNPISQIDLTLKNVSQELFTEDTELFVPGGKIELGLMMGDSSKLPIGVAYIDEIDFSYNAKTASVSGRNVVGFILNDQYSSTPAVTYNTIEGHATTLMQYFGVEHYVIEPSPENAPLVPLPVTLGLTGVECLQLLADLASDGTAGNNWDYEVLPDGTVVCGYDAFRADYLPKGHFEINGKNDLFKRKVSRSIDGVYKRVYCYGEDENGNELTMASEPIDTWDYWEPGSHRVYFPAKLKGVTQQQLNDYAKNLAEQLRLVGVNESYTGPIRPQLLVGDVVDQRISSEAVRSIGTITEITHTFGERGYTTDFTVSSGGQVTDEQGRVYTNNRDVKGNARKKRISDFIN